MVKDDNKILMIFIEPTPYILDLIAILNTVWLGQIDILFLKKNFSQDWGLSIKKNYHLWSNNPFIIIPTLYQRLVKEKYKLIFLAGWIHPVCLTFMILSKFFGIPVIVDSDTPLFSSTPRWKQIIKRMIYPILFKMPTMFLPAGKRQANYLAHYGVPPNKIILEKMTVDVIEIQRYIRQLKEDSLEHFRKRFGLSTDDFVFLFVGRLIERKGIKELLQAFSKINRRQAKLIIVGDGPLKLYVEHVSKNSSYLHYAGRLEKQALFDMYFISNVFILPAHWEPWGLVINEAMAAGKPVIVSDQLGCIDDLVIPWKTGLIVKNKSIDEIIESIVYFMDHPKQYLDMSKNALQHMAHWTLNDEATQICIAFRNVISEYALYT